MCGDSRLYAFQLEIGMNQIDSASAIVVFLSASTIVNKETGLGLVVKEGVVKI